MDRRHFLSGFATGVSGSFLFGTAGGLSIGAASTAVGMTAYQRAQPWSRTSHAQQGEDLIVETIFQRLGITQPSYLDIGAADPIRINNTYLFYKAGGRGVLVEPNPVLIGKLRSARPGDTVLNVGIGFTDQADADYFLIGGPGGADLNTFSREVAEAYSGKTGGYHFIDKVIKMPLVNVNKVIAEHFKGAPDFVNIDVEGLDLDILKSFDFGTYRPAIFCVETLVYGTVDVETATIDLLRSKDYIVRGDTFVNTIFVDKRRLKAK